MLILVGRAEERCRDLDTCRTRVAVTSDESADGNPSGYALNARGLVGDLLLDASTSRVWYMDRGCAEVSA